jgi:transposase-like protein
MAGCFVKVGNAPEARFEELHFTEPVAIACPRCGSNDTYKYGTRGDSQVFLCVDCGRKFDLRDLAYGMRHTAEVIGGALSQYFKGMSLSDIAGELAQQGQKVNRTTVYRWVTHYSEEAIRLLGAFKAQTGSMWAVDETYLDVAGQQAYHWDLIDADTRYLLASYLAYERDTMAAVTLFRDAMEHTDIVPELILTDGLPSYTAAIPTVFSREDTAHIRTGPFTPDLNTNLIERWHGTLKERTKVLRGLKSIESARTLLKGFVVDYNFMRPHLSLNGRTPAQQAGYNGPVNSWRQFVEFVHSE